MPWQLPGFWEKGTWSGNSLDLSPIENLWAAVKAELNKMEPATSEKTRIQNVQSGLATDQGRDP